METVLSDSGRKHSTVNQSNKNISYIKTVLRNITILYDETVVNHSKILGNFVETLRTAGKRCDYVPGGTETAYPNLAFHKIAANRVFVSNEHFRTLLR